jgi:hypothetical protein
MLVLAQSMVEYGVLARAIDAVGGVVSRAQVALREPQIGVPTALVVVALAYFLIRRR